MLPRTMGVLSLLVGRADGLTLGEIAAKLDIPKSAAHRTLADLIDLGLVAQERLQGRYHLGLRFISLALTQLENIPPAAVAGPVLDRLAKATGELARFGLPDGDRIVWVAKRQGSHGGLRFDSDSGGAAKLIRTSTGLAWLSTMPEGRARALIESEGFDDLENYGPEGPSTLEEALAGVSVVRESGFSFTDSTWELGIAALAVPVGHPALGVLVVAGPSVRLPRERALELVPVVRAAAEELERAVVAWSN
ncbi:IclR family transcriptional regulator [Salinibacterium hongtaonis]|nr:IclR family transcriptional regulator [Salinibacterium hongtaonis]